MALRFHFASLQFHSLWALVFLSFLRCWGIEDARPRLQLSRPLHLSLQPPHPRRSGGRAGRESEPVDGRPVAVLQGTTPPVKVTPQIPGTTTKERGRDSLFVIRMCVCFRFPPTPLPPFLSGVHCAPGVGIGAGQKGKSSLLTFVQGVAWVGRRGRLGERDRERGRPGRGESAFLAILGGLRSGWLDKTKTSTRCYWHS